MAFEWVETSRTFARLVAEIDVAWLEPIAGHLIKRQYHEPYWSRKQGRVMAKETLSLYGLAIVADRPADFGKVDPEGDGLNVSVTLAQLPLLNQDSLARLVPGILPQKIEAMIRALPKPLRVRLQPAVGQAEQAAKTVIALPSQPTVCTHLFYARKTMFAIIQPR